MIENDTYGAKSEGTGQKKREDRKEEKSEGEGGGWHGGMKGHKKDIKRMEEKGKKEKKQ